MRISIYIMLVSIFFCVVHFNIDENVNLIKNILLIIHNFKQFH